MDIEFIICWEDRTWTTEVYGYKKEDLPCKIRFTYQGAVKSMSILAWQEDEIDYDKICTERMEKIIKEIIPAAKNGVCPRGGPVHVGIYHINEECSY